MILTYLCFKKKGFETQTRRLLDKESCVLDRIVFIKSIAKISITSVIKTLIYNMWKKGEACNECNECVTVKFRFPPNFYVVGWLMIAKAAVP